jgi:hypothetical protein
MPLKRALVVLLTSSCVGMVGDMPDAGGDSPDAAMSNDAGAADSGTPDAGVTDAGSDDAGLPDAGMTDSGTPDSGTPDAGSVDAGSRPVFIIGGQDERHLVSFDGRAWQDDTYIAPNGEDNAYSGIAVGAGAIVMSGDPGIVRSTDGVSYTLTQMRPSRFAFHGSVAAFNGSVFVVVGQADTWRSADGITWDHAMNTGNAGHWQGVAFGNGHWVAVGDGYTKVSEDGLAWHDYTATPDPNPVAALAFGNGVFVAVGGKSNMGRALTSTDGVTWTEQPLVTTSYNTGFAGVAFGNGRFVASDCCSAFESTDGVTWTKRGHGFQGAIAYSSGTFIAAGWRTSAAVYDADAGAFTTTFSGDQPNMFPDAGLWPWFTAVGAGTF